jgi:hypothetical protein
MLCEEGEQKRGHDDMRDFSGLQSGASGKPLPSKRRAAKACQSSVSGRARDPAVDLVNTHTVPLPRILKKAKAHCPESKKKWTPN